MNPPVRPNCLGCHGVIRPIVSCSVRDAEICPYARVGADKDPYVETPGSAIPMIGPRLVEVNYYRFQAALQQAANSGRRIEKRDKTRWAAYVKAHDVKEASSLRIAQASSPSVQPVIIESGEGEGYYLYSSDDEVCLKFTRPEPAASPAPAPAPTPEAAPEPAADPAPAPEPADAAPDDPPPAAPDA